MSLGYSLNHPGAGQSHHDDNGQEWPHTRHDFEDNTYLYITETEPVLLKLAAYIGRMGAHLGRFGDSGMDIGSKVAYWPQFLLEYYVVICGSTEKSLERAEKRTMSTNFGINVSWSQEFSISGVFLVYTFLNRSGSCRTTEGTADLLRKHLKVFFLLKIFPWEPLIFNRTTVCSDRVGICKHSYQSGKY